MLRDCCDGWDEQREREREKELVWRRGWLVGECVAVLVMSPRERSLLPELRC